MVNLLMASQEVENRRMPLFRHFSQIAVPAALNQDKLGTGSHVDSAKALADKIAGSEFVLVEGGRHGYLREMPEKGHPPILDFLRRH